MKIRLRGSRRRLFSAVALVALTAAYPFSGVVLRALGRATLSAPFERQVLAPAPAGGAEIGDRRDALALTRDGRKLYLAMGGGERSPDSRVAVVDTALGQLLRWIDLRPPGEPRPTRPVGLQVSPSNSAIAPAPYAVVLNEYANFATVIDTATDSLIGDFETGFHGQDLVFNHDGSRLYITDPFGDQVRAFAVHPGPTFSLLATIPAGGDERHRAQPRDLSLSADGQTLYVSNTVGRTLAVIDLHGDANALVGVVPVDGPATDVKVAGRWGIVAGAAREPARGVSGSKLSVFDTATNRFVFCYVEEPLVAAAGRVAALGDLTAAKAIIHGHGPEQITVRGDFLFVSQRRSDTVELFRIDQDPPDPSRILTFVGMEPTGGVTPRSLVVSPDGRTVYVSNLQTEDVSFLDVDPAGRLVRRGQVAVGAVPSTRSAQLISPQKRGGS